MATQAQLETAEKFFRVMKNTISSLKSTITSAQVAINFYNGLTNQQKTGLLALRDLDQTEAEAVLTRLQTIKTEVDQLPNVNAQF